MKELTTFLADIQTSEVIADKAYDSRAVRAMLASRGILPTIPPQRRLGRQLPLYDAASYRRRHLVENLFAHLKQFRGVATRYCKLVQTYAAMVQLAAWVMATRGRHDLVGRRGTTGGSSLPRRTR